MADAAFTCRGCGRSFTGARTCHCSGCHLTFSGITGFDDHQVRGRCLPLADITAGGYQEVRPGVLGRPSPTQRGKDRDD